MTSSERLESLAASDRATRERAQREFAGPLVVEAGAGTGKTAILVARVAAWALGPGWERAEARLVEQTIGIRPHADAIAADCLGRVVAITFTEAAAAEMAERTGRELQAISRGEFPAGFFEENFPADAALRSERGRALIGALDHFVVRTIHAFCRGLLAQFPLEAGVHPGFQIDADELVQAEVVREVVEAAVARAYAGSGDADWIALAVAGQGPAEIETALAELVRSGATPQLFESDPFAPERISAFLSALAAAAAAFEAADGNRLATGKRSKAGVKTVDAIASMRAIHDRGVEATLAGLTAFVEELDGIFEDSLRARLKDWSGGKFNKAETTALDEDTAACASAAAELCDLTEHLLGLDPERVERGRRVLAPLLAEVHETLRRRGAATYDSLLRDAVALVEGDPRVLARVRSEIDQLLVDEFQDTDPQQCALVRRLALEGEADDRPGLFLVGDPKQSIYGWRNADLGAYHDFVREVLGEDTEPDRLSLNFRSRPGILAEVENAIEPVMRAEAGMQPAFQPLIPHREADASGGPVVEYWVSWGRDAGTGAPVRPNANAAARLEADAIARDLRARHERGELEWSSVGLLFRATGYLDTYLQALRRAGIPYAVERDRSYYRRREISDASALVRCVLDPLDHVALLAWLRTPAVGVPDGAWLPLWRRDFAQLVSALSRPDEAFDAVDALIDAAVADLPDAIPGLTAIEGWERGLKFGLRALASLRASFAHDPTDLFVEKLRSLSLIEATESARHLGAFRVANLDRFFREVQGELESTGDPSALLRRLRGDVAERKDAEEARPAIADQAVRVMTIHKAKGLDFHHTYVVQLHKESGGNRRDPARTELVSAPGGMAEYRLWGAPTLGFGAVEAKRARVSAAEQVRALYVAMTRARERLVLLGNWAAAPVPVEAARAKSQLALLASRKSGVPDGLAEVLAGGAADSDARPIDEGPVRWLFPGLDAADASSSPVAAAPTRAPATAVKLAADALELAARRAEAAVRSARPWNKAPSEDAHAGASEVQAERRFREADATASAAALPRPERAVARAVGTAVHRVLEEFDLAADLTSEIERQRERLPVIARSLAGGGDVEAVAQAAAEMLEKLAAGALIERLRGLRACVVARELPVLLPPADEAGAVGFIAGSIDLCYRDPEGGEFVVVDYKTDRIANDAELAERAGHYAAQGRAYQSALRDALGLTEDPRFELWFLDADRIEVVA